MNREKPFTSRGKLPRSGASGRDNRWKLAGNEMEEGTERIL